MILAGDIGGTNTRLAQFDADGQPQNIKEYPSRDYDSLEEIVTEYVALNRTLYTRACFGVAGPVKEEGGRLCVRTTNLKWVVDQHRLAEAIGVPPGSVGIINDLAANATGIAALPPDRILELAPGERHDEENRAIISAGTGLGVAGLLWDEKGGFHRPVPSEGGHSSFGPRNELEDDLLRFLRGRDRQAFNGHVSWERVLSGPGLYNLFAFLRHRGEKEQTLVLSPDLSPGDAAREVVKAGLTGTCPRSEAALDLFVALYGAAAGNVALQFLSLGGLYVGGGIAPRIKDKLRGAAFMDAFLDKGPLRGRALEKIPVRVILDPHTALRGAGRYAEKLMV